MVTRDYWNVLSAFETQSGGDKIWACDSITIISPAVYSF